VIPPDERQQLIIKLSLKTTLLSHLASWLRPKVIKNRLNEPHYIDWGSAWCVCCSPSKRVWNHICMSPFTDAWCPQGYLLYTSLQVISPTIVSPTSHVYFAAVQCLSRLWIASVFLSFDMLTAMQTILIGKLSRLVLLTSCTAC